MTLEFENELDDMTATARSALKDFYNGHVVFEEFPYGSYRTDLVVVKMDKSSLWKRKQAVGNLEAFPDEQKYRRSYREIQREEPITKREWVEDDSTYIERTAKQTWEWLVDHGYLRHLEDEEVGGQARLDTGIAGAPTEDDLAVTVKFPDCVRAYAIELKQTDWEQALRQARRAEHYAERQVVVMDEGAVDRALDNQSRFKDDGVGLVSLAADGTVTRHVSPNRYRPLQTRSRRLLNERALSECPGKVIGHMNELFSE